jgi:G3E family GTPase
VRLPVTIIGGYLGAGKTTLVNHLLRNAEGVRLAVLVNEFGELPIDADLIEAQDENMISIAGGCVCCSYGNDLVMAMIELAKMSPPPQHVLLEASGVALPGAIAATVGLLGNYALDGVLVLVDAETITQRASDRYMGDTIMHQLTDADIVVLNKIDLVPPDQLKETVDWLSDKVSGARIVPVVHATLPPEVALESFVGRPRVAGAAHSHQSPAFASTSFIINEPIDVTALAQRLTEVGLARAKGFAVSLDGSVKTIQVVGKRWEVSPAPSGVRPGIVCIGLDDQLDIEALKGMAAAME